MKDLLLLAFVFLAYGLVGTWDLEDNKRVEQQLRGDATVDLVCANATTPRASPVRPSSSRPVSDQPIHERDVDSHHSRCHDHPEATHALN